MFPSVHTSMDLRTSLQPPPPSPPTPRINIAALIRPSSSPNPSRPRSRGFSVRISTAGHGTVVTIRSSRWAWRRSVTVKAVLAEKPETMSSAGREAKNIVPSIYEEMGISGAGRSSLDAGGGGGWEEGEMGAPDTDLESRWVHRMWVSTGGAAIGGMLWKALCAADSMDAIAAILFSIAIAYILADLGTGIYHWGVDNYGSAKTAVFGPQIDAFQGHHKWPSTIARRQPANNLHALARPAALSLAPFLLLPSHAGADAFLAALLFFAVGSQQFHAWAHTRPRLLPPLVVAMQERGLLVSRKMHGSHHRPPYNVNYCIVSGMWNPLLDRTRFFEKLELLIYWRWGVKPRSWNETLPQWLQEGSYFSDGSDLDGDSQ